MAKRISRGVRKQIEREFTPQLEAKDKKIAELKRRAGVDDAAINSLRMELDQTKGQVTRFLEREGALRMEVRRDIGPHGQRYRLVLDIDEQTIRRHLEWGNDFRIIEMLGDHLGRQAARQIATINLSRDERDPVTFHHRPSYMR